uniref:ribonucleoside-diphosphate reductase n=1 Tax=viral metagenome TaxID=1070528 RepID=A0A6C0AQS5_9ZZZZ
MNNFILYLKNQYKIIHIIYINMNSSIEMRVTKRNGELQDIAFDKILERVKKLGQEANIQINFSSLVMKVIDQLYDTIPTGKIDELAAEQCASMSTNHPDYATFAGRISVSNHQKNTDPLFTNVITKLYEFTNSRRENKSLISQKLFEFTQHYANEINSMIDHNRDYLVDYFGFKTLERAYLFRINNIIVERPQHMWMRVSIGIHGDLTNPEESFRLVKETYDLMSQKFFTHATPTLFNAGTPRPQLSSCYLIAMEDDSIDGIYNTLGDCAQISKYSGGIGLHIHNVRAKGSHIQGTNGKTDGLVPMLRVFNSTARYVNQSGKRNGSFAVYLEPWHPDIEDFLELRKNHGDEELKARDLFYAVWISDLFMERVKENKQWSLFCPNECSGLDDVYGDKFKTLYQKYEGDGLARKVVNARDLWFKILDAQMETGTPYILFKDACNQKSNQQNIGTIKSSNLCTEILEYSDENETAVCNLASIALPAFVDHVTKQFDYNKLHEVAKVVTNNLNRVIDINFYPTEKTKTSNFRHRPIGIGVQGLADTFILMDLPFYSEEAKEVNKFIFETIYHGALEKSNEISIQRAKVIQELLKGDRFKLLEFVNKFDYTLLPSSKNTNQNENLLGAYSSFVGSPASKGILQFDMWNVEPSDRYDWTTLKQSIIQNGIRNSLLIAPMPTASTSQILGYNECFEPFTSNLYSRRTLAGEFVVVNKYLMRELIDLGLWNEQIKNNIIANKGSVQQLTVLSDHIRNKYKIVWEMPMKHLIDMSADRGAFICQSQSLNLWLEDPTYNSLTSMHFYSWKKGLKTGIYYLRRKAKHQAQQFTIEPELKENEDNKENEICDMCSA